MIGPQYGKAIFLFAAITLICFSCAEIVSPPGGEEDKTAPHLISSVPVNGTVNVAPSDRIELYFSETVVEPTRDNPIYISPRLKDKPKIKWKADRVILELPDSFETDQTYIISVTPTITDLRNNRLDSSIIIAFSTGSMIDSGAVAGFVYNNNKPQSGALVALYDLAKFPDSIPFDSIYPDYMTSSSQKGYYSFQYLPCQNYRLVAFNDKNKDERFNPFREEFALPDRAINIDSEVPLNNILMTMTTFDTSKVNIISAALNPDNLLKIRITKNIPLDLLRISPANIVLYPQADTTKAIYASSFQETDLEESSIITVFFKNISVGSYNLRLTHDAVKPALEFKNIELAPKEDNNRPLVTEFKPGDRPVFLSEVKIQIGLSEPVDSVSITDHSFLLWESDTIPVPIEKNWLDPFHLVFNTALLKPGSQYRLDITEFDIIDLAGKAMGDSLLSYKFSILNADSLGAIAGEIIIDLPDLTGSPVVLTFNGLDSKRNFDLTVSEKNFKIDVPAGKYLLSGFIDKDMNEERSPGVIYPFKMAEPMAFYPDTIRVRARFETTDIKFEFK